MASDETCQVFCFEGGGFVRVKEAYSRSPYSPQWLLTRKSLIYRYVCALGDASCNVKSREGAP